MTPRYTHAKMNIDDIHTTGDSNPTINLRGYSLRRVCMWRSVSLVLCVSVGLHLMLMAPLCYSSKGDILLLASVSELRA